MVAAEVEANNVRTSRIEVEPRGGEGGGPTEGGRNTQRWAEGAAAMWKVVRPVAQPGDQAGGQKVNRRSRASRDATKEAAVAGAKFWQEKNEEHQAGEVQSREEGSGSNRWRC